MASVGRIFIKPATLGSLYKAAGTGVRSASTFSSDDGEILNARQSESSKTKKNRGIAERISAVIDKFHDRKLPPAVRGSSNYVRSETDLVNIVERRIWHSMEEGQFENLPGKGKPLELNSNPHADPAEDTLYRILSKNGFTPEWIELNKDIRLQIKDWRNALRKVWARRSSDVDMKWKEDSEKLQECLRDINNKVVTGFSIQPYSTIWASNVWFQMGQGIAAVRTARFIASLTWKLPAYALFEN